MPSHKIIVAATEKKVNNQIGASKIEKKKKKTKLCIKIKLCSKLSIPVIFVGGGVVIIASPDFENKIESKHWNKC